MARNREHVVEDYLDVAVQAIGGITRKWVSPGRAGVPDRIVIYRGFVMFVELKTVDGKLDPWQRREHERLRDNGVAVTTLYGIPGVDRFIPHLKTLGNY